MASWDVRNPSSPSVDSVVSSDGSLLPRQAMPMQSFPPREGQPGTPPPPPVSTLPPPSMPLADAWSAGAKKGRGGPSLPRLPQGKRVIAVGAGALVLVLVAVAAYRFVGPGKAGSEKNSLAFSLTKGQTARYRFAMSIMGTGKVGGASIPIDDNLTGTMNWQVDSVDPSGVATITAKAPKVTEISNGKKSSPVAQTFHLRIAPDGHILAQVGFGTTSGKDNSGPGMPGSDQVTPLLPDHPVAVGESWTTAFDQTNPMGTGVIHYQTTSKLLRYAEVNGFNTAVIYTTADLPIDVSLDTRKALVWTGQPTSNVRTGTNPTYWLKGHMAFSQTAWLDTASNSLVRSTTAGQFVFVLRLTHIDPRDQPPGGKIDVTGSVSIELQSTRSQLIGS